jgi:aminoglycoside phosphotransferase (APT) family kinase protein
MTGSVIAIDVVDRGGRRHRLVLKLYTPEPTEPDSPKREAHILELLRTSDLTVPRVVAVEADGLDCEMPALLMTRLPGRPRIWPRQMERWVDDLAASSAHIHATPIPPEFLPAYARYEHDRPTAPSWSTQPEMWEKAIATIEKPPPPHRKTFIHRDFHAGNVLWKAGALIGVVDWLHGCWGPPEQDLAHCRLNIWCNQGPAAADALVKAYQRLVPDAPPYHPYWDLDEALGNHGAENAFGNPRRYESFIAAAVSKL